MDYKLEFGKLELDGQEFSSDVVLYNNGTIIKRPKEISKPKKEKYGHTPLTREELEVIIKRNFDYILIGTGIYGYLPIEKEAIDYLKEKCKFIIIGKSSDILEYLKQKQIEGEYIAIIHITC